MEERILSIQLSCAFAIRIYVIHQQLIEVYLYYYYYPCCRPFFTGEIINKTYLGCASLNQIWREQVSKNFEYDFQISENDD